MFPSVHGVVSQVSQRSYATILRDDYGASEVWPLVDIASGTTIPAFVNSNRDGVQTGWDLQSAAGPVSGTLAPYSDGVNDFGNVFSSNGSDGLADIFNGATGSVFSWFQIVDAASWGLGWKRLLELTADNNNFILIQKDGAATARLYFYYKSGGTQKLIEQLTSTLAWFSVGLSWDINAGASGEFKSFLNGVQVGSTQTSLVTWSGNLTLATITKGSADASWDGWAAYAAVKFDSVWTPADFAAMHAAAATAGAD